MSLQYHFSQRYFLKCLNENDQNSSKLLFDLLLICKFIHNITIIYFIYCILIRILATEESESVLLKMNILNF